MNIVYGTDENFIYPTMVSMVSVWENHKDVEEIHIYVIGEKLSEKSIQLLQKQAQIYQRPVTVIPCPNLEELAGEVLDIGCWSRAAFVRLFLCSILDETVDKVLWLDGDIIVDRNLETLWNVDLCDNLIAAVLDSGTHFKQTNGFKNTEPYYNSGMILISLTQWRKEQVEKKIVDIIQVIHGKSPDVDQGILNKALKGRVLTLPMRYNVASSCYLFNEQQYRNLNRFKEGENYALDERRKAIEKPYIIHYTSTGPYANPWIEGCIHPKANVFEKYKQLSLWKDEPIRPNKFRKYIYIDWYCKRFFSKSLLLITVYKKLFAIASAIKKR